MNKMLETAPARFWEKVEIRGPGECWPWTAAQARGYGTFVVTKHPKRIARSNRFVWELTHGQEPDGFVCHSCDNPLCCNPDHLWIGTHIDNMNDMRAKGRAAKQSDTHCQRGHEFTPENTYVSVGHNGNTRRTCRECVRVGHRQQYKANIGKPKANRTAKQFHCEMCGEAFLRLPKDINRGRTRFCSQTCSNRRDNGGRFKKSMEPTGV